MLALQVGSCLDWGRMLGAEAAPFLLGRDNPDMPVELVPVTQQATQGCDELDGHLTLVAVDGRPLPKGAGAESRGVGRPGFSRGPLPVGLVVDPSTRWTVRDVRGRECVLSPPWAAAQPAVTLRYLAWPLSLPLLGWLYVLMGGLVWWRRPDDPSTPALLVLCASASINLSAPMVSDALRWVEPLRFSVLPIWAASAAQLALRFAGLSRHVWLRRAVRASWGVAAPLVLLMLIAGSDLLGSSKQLLRVSLVGAGIYALWALALAGVIAWHGVRRATSLALRRRARLLAAALFLGFGWPSVSLVLGPLGLLPAWFFHLNAFFFATFPLLVGYAILRHRLFDLRIVVRRGLVYGVLTLGVSMGYLLLVSTVARVVRKSPSPGLLVLLVAVAVVAFGILQVRVQRAVERFVNRRRYAYADALAAASNALSHDRTTEAIGESVRAALLDAMQLERAYFALWSDRRERQKLICTPLLATDRAEGAKEPGAEEEGPLVLPGLLDPSAASPIARALSLGALVTTYDSAAMVELTRAEHAEAHEPGGEAGFWLHHGLECIVPLSLGGEASSGKVVGLLLLGPKRDGSRLDEADLAMLSTLANQLSLAIEGANAFAEIQRLNAGLEQEVAERTAELERALAELKQMQGQLVEAETQATLGRVVAGIVHEVNTPLGGLTSGTDTVERIYARVRPLIAERFAANADDAEARRALKALDKGTELASLLRRSSQRISDVLGSLRRFVSLDEAEIKPLDLRRGLEDVLTLLSPRLPAGVRVETSFPERPPMVRCQPARLNRAFLNVLENALTAIEGEGTIEVIVREADERWLEVEIADSGRGIPAKRQAALFQVELAAKTDGRVGLRLGLPSAKRWVEELGGQLSVQSEEGVGTRVRFRLPAVGADASA